MKNKKLLLPLLVVLCVGYVALRVGATQQVTANGVMNSDDAAIDWNHLSSKSGDLPVPTGSTQQTSTLILDIDKDGLNDFVIGARRSPGPSLVWYRRQAEGWEHYVIDDTVLRIEAGGTFSDIDFDGDLDIVMGGDGGVNTVWWWENPYPNYNPGTNWTRRDNQEVPALINIMISCLEISTAMDGMNWFIGTRRQRHCFWQKSRQTKTHHPGRLQPFTAGRAAMNMKD